MINFVKGDFFDYGADVRVNTVNCVGVMGAGVALAFKNKFPEMYEEYVSACNSGKIKIGKPHVWQDNKFFSLNPIIINFPTKDHWKKPSEYEYVEKGLVWLRQYLKEKGKVTITLPALGCGHGGLDWVKVKDLITKYLNDLDANILVFEPSSSHISSTSNEINSDLEKNRVKKILPNDEEYPIKLKGKSACEIYLKGDKNAFKNKILSIIVDLKATDREKLAVFKCLEHLNYFNFTYLLGYNSSFEIDVVKYILNKNSKIIIVIPYGILELKIRRDLKEIWDEGKITIVSLSQPNQGWRVSESINSLKFRIKISDVILITTNNYEQLEKFESDLNESSSHLFYLNYWNEPIEFYNRINAKKIGKNKETLLPNLQPVLELLR